MKICPNCGNKLRDDVDFCSECGMNVKEVPVQQYVAPQPVDMVNNKPAKGGMLPIIFGAIAILFSIFAFISFAPQNVSIFASSINAYIGYSLPAFVAIILAYIDLSNGKDKGIPTISIILGAVSLFLLFIAVIVRAAMGAY